MVMCKRSHGLTTVLFALLRDIDMEICIYFCFLINKNTRFTHRLRTFIYCLNFCNLILCISSLFESVLVVRYENCENRSLKFLRYVREVSVMITESLQTSKHISPEEKLDKFPDKERYYYYCQDTNERDKNSPDLQYGVSCHDSSIVSSNGKIQYYCAIIFLYCSLFKTKAIAELIILYYNVNYSVIYL